MVKKGSKRMLNTGNTIRQYHRGPVLRQYQRYGCLVVGNSIERTDTRAAKVMKEVMNVLPNNTTGVELSLNKQRRWELPSYMKNKTEIESDNKDVQITVMEHRMSVPVFRPIDEWDKCTSYYSNHGAVRQCVSSTEMNVKSAKQGHRDEDHLCKLERREFKKAKQRAGFDSEVVQQASRPSYECRIAYGAKTNGQFYMELGTKGFAQTSKKNRSHTSGCSKRYLSRTHFSDDDLSMHSDADSFGDFDDYDDVITEIPSVSLSDYIVPSRRKIKQRKSELKDFVFIQ
ncbi:uncharacterized protein [Watersipora subatra]|uniref:uncharacterized protein n=1 Tax=Watersipora subatra TaxID=2589382 RepID=UPI00355BA486